MNQFTAVMMHVRRRDGHGGGTSRSDGELLREYLAGHDEAAFATLVHRHGPMVLGVSRRVLCNPHDAEDVFQATFLVLSRKAEELRDREVIGDWLHGVAYHTALKARDMVTRRREKERRTARPEAVAGPAAPEWLGVLDDEVRALPEHHRRFIVLCDLLQKCRREVAAEPGIPAGTVASGLARARALLAKRLRRRGFVVSCVTLGPELARAGAACLVPWTWLAAAVRTAGQVVSGAAGLTLASARAVTLAKLTLCASALTKTKGLVLLFTLMLGTSGAMAIAHWGDDETLDLTKPGGVLHAEQVWPTPEPAQPQERPRSAAIPPRHEDTGPVQTAPKDPEVLILDQLGLSEEQRVRYAKLRDLMAEGVQKMYQHPSTQRQRASELSRFYRNGLRDILTPDQYRRYMDLLAKRTPPGPARAGG